MEESTHIIANVAFASPLDPAFVACTCGVTYSAPSDQEIASWFSAHIRPFGRIRPPSQTSWWAGRHQAQMEHEEVVDRGEFDRG